MSIINSVKVQLTSSNVDPPFDILHSSVLTTLDEQIISTQNFRPHGILGTDFFRRTQTSAQSCVKYQMGGSKFDELSCTLMNKNKRPTIELPPSESAKGAQQNKQPNVVNV